MKHPIFLYAEQMQLEGIELIFGIKGQSTVKFVLSKEWKG
jgi:hypothetical protein